MDSGRIKWMEKARSIQNQMCRVLGNRLYDEIDESNLKNKVGFAIFGAPISDCFNEEQSKRIEEINKKITSLSGEVVYINFVYVLIKSQSNQEEGIEVVFRLGKWEKNGFLQPPIFLDLALQVYKDWNHYLETNKLPKCCMCYPVNGVYEKNEKEIVKLDFGESHGFNGVSSFLNITDEMITTGRFISLGILGASFFTTISYPVTIGCLATSVASSAYGLTRYWPKLTDVIENDEDMESSEEANMAEFGVLTSAAGLASLESCAALKTAQKIGVKGSANLLKVMKILNISSLCINGSSVANGMYNIVLERHKGNLETKDVFAFVLACSFMFNAVISTAMAERMIKEISQKHMDKLGNVISMVSCPVSPAIHVANEHEENYKRLLSLIVGLPALFADSIDLHKIECSILNIRVQTKSLVRLETDLKTFVSKISEDLQALWECYEKLCKQISNAIYNITYNPKFYLKNENGQMVPRPLNIGIMYDLNSKVRRTAENLSLNQSEEKIKKREVLIVRLARDFDELEPAENLSEFFFKVNFFCNRLVKKCQELKDEYDNKRDVAMMAEDFNECIFNSRNGIRSDNLNDHFFLETVTPSAKDFKYWYTIYNELEKGPFKDNYFQDFEYESVFPFCCPPNGSNLTEKEYFSYATKFSAMKIDQTTSEMFTDGRLVVLNPLPQQPVPRVLFYNPENTEETRQQNCPVGIAVVQKNQRKVQTNPVELLKEMPE